MIRLEALRIVEFRGIRDLTLNIKGHNFAACGPNGTGKSGIIDAIEFALTGNISRLTGSGTRGLSVKTHGPHVDSRDKPDKAIVTLEVTIPSLGNKKTTIQRSAKLPTSPTITPNDADIIAALKHVEVHPEFALSRRELIRYVVSEPGQRAKEVQALLRLDELEKLRAVLQRISNACAREMLPLERLERDALTNLLAALNITELSISNILAATNPKREVLGLPSQTNLEATTSVKDGITTATSAGVSTRVSKSHATKDLAALRGILEKLKSTTFEQVCIAAASAAATLSKDAEGVDSVSREALIHSALALFDEKACPVCDTPFEADAFRQRLARKLKHFDEVGAKRRALEGQITPILDVIHNAIGAITAVVPYGSQLIPTIDVSVLNDIKSVLAERYRQLQKLLPLKDTQAALLAVPKVPPLAKVMERLEDAVSAIPEPTKQDAARDFLVIAQERLENYRALRRKLAAAKLHAQRAEKAFNVYGRVTTEALEGTYKAVETAFTEFYRRINHEDEGKFTAKLMPSMGKLGFDVDFYGRGHFPPGAYHSEGHQDGMGLCLYLALMKHLQGNNFTLAVLDDVLMSVDAGHRREVCSLLKESFPNTQFVFTTHDEIWLRHMKSEGLIKGRNLVHFRTWNVDVGPADWSNHDIWTELDAHLTKNDVQAASALLRHYLEHFAKEACDRLRATVEYRGDAQFTLGELLPNATSALGDILKRAKVAANSWNQKNVIEAITAREKSFVDSKQKSGHEQWQINAAIHFNEWANLQRQDFAHVVSAFKIFTEMFLCSSCGEMFYVVPDHGPKKENLRCGCGALNLNLTAKG